MPQQIPESTPHEEGFSEKTNRWMRFLAVILDIRNSIAAKKRVEQKKTVSTTPGQEIEDTTL